MAAIEGLVTPKLGGGESSSEAVSMASAANNTESEGTSSRESTFLLVI